MAAFKPEIDTYGFRPKNVNPRDTLVIPIWKSSLHRQFVRPFYREMRKKFQQID